MPARRTRRRNWMAELADHYERIRSRYPDDNLMIVFDLDGTIFDMRYMVLYVLHLYDRVHQTDYFRHLNAEAIDVHENHVDPLIRRLFIPPQEQAAVLKWYYAHRRTPAAILEAHRPFRGVMEVIRWFQIQPHTFVGLNTGRPEHVRQDTLYCLNELGKAYRVHFDEELLYMNPNDWEEQVIESKVAGIRHFQSKGFRVFAVVDNEPAVLQAISAIDPDEEILLLHAATIFESKRVTLPSQVVRGHEYDITELIPERALPQNIQLVWHGINDRANLRQFLATSRVRWGECDVIFDPTRRELILRHDTFEETPPREDEEWLTLDEALAAYRQWGKAAKLDLKEDSGLIEHVLALVNKHGFADEELWFNGEVHVFQEQDFRRLAEVYPGAIIQCSIDFLAPLVVSAPEKAKEVLDMFREWGINRFSINWLVPKAREFFNQMDAWGFEVNIYNVPDLEGFLQAVLLMPRSITTDFNFPKWHYFGRGAGQRGRYIEYQMRKSRR
ncbi:MAG: hypothetical protein Q9O62_14145 [Ardenticatenia bacterium]|nr:hypothetical protein [Ardenticatenia bacterium]